jgi:DNA polymerase III subunit gamma/tau
MLTTTLNLARKWRAHSFDTLVGQELVVKILKNSLFTAHYFPVYLFAGQRGCGKTSTARIFAAALNCTQLQTFQAKPKEVLIPCGSCESCSAMMQGRHPDFIEIDAASHTGVDNMRSIIDASYYLPVLGRKKIYLIDEAHMLSKAAFNALLKLFEEPPLHAHFILATTDPEKIIETVRSRCFTLFFGAIENNLLTEHLKYLCVQESIEYSSDALSYIARAAEGSARDAINILETVRFSYPSVTKEAVLRVLGHVDDQQLMNLVMQVLHGDTKSYLATWREHIAPRASAQQLWLGLVRLVRGIIWHQYGAVATDVSAEMLNDAAKISPQKSTQLLETLYHIEPLFIRSSNQQTLLEFSLLQLCARFKKSSDNSSYGQSGVLGVAEPKEEDVVIIEVDEDGEPSEEEHDVDEEETVLDMPVSAESEKIASTLPVSTDEKLVACKTACSQLTDQILSSVLSQITSVTHDAASNRLLVHAPAQFSFFADMVNNKHAVWASVIAQIYAHTGLVGIVFDAVVDVPVTEKRVASIPVLKPTAQPLPVKEKQTEQKQTQVAARFDQKYAPRSTYPSRPRAIAEKSLDVSDRARWPLTNRVLDFFPGTVTVVNEARP